MTDERFERDLAGLLRGISGGEAPASLRDRVASIVAQAPAGRRPWFSSPMRLSLAGATAVAVVAVAFLVSQSWTVVGPPPSASPAPPSASATPETPGPSPSGSPVPPSASPGATTTPIPTTPPSTLPTVSWTGLAWAGPVPVPNAGSGTSLRLDQVVPWGAGYVGVGSLMTGLATDGGDTADTGIAAVFLTSRDGLHWTISHREPAVPGDAQCEIEVVTPHHVAVAPDGTLLASSDSCAPGNASPKLWRSTNGLSWSAVQSASWQAIWSSTGGTNTLFDLAAGPGGIVAIGGRGSWCCGISGSPEVGQALVAFSTDGLTWQRLTLSSAFDSAWLRDVVAYAGGFAIVGRVGEPSGAVSSGDGATPSIAIYTGIGRPAAWVSADGKTWRRATVEGSQQAGATLTRAVAGANGLFAIGWQTSAAGTYAVGGDSGWASTDGVSWHLVGDLGGKLPFVDAIAGDGSHMVILGHQVSGATAPSGWSSTDGVQWTRLAFSGSTSLPTLAQATPVAVVRSGLVVIDVSPGGAAQESWFAVATGP